MHRKGSCLKVCLTLFLFFGSVPSASSQTNLEYQNRVNRYEGIKPKPVSGYDIELISVLADYREEIKAMPKRLKVRFYLDRLSDVHLTVRELDYKHHYWLDRVRPRKPWRLGFDNVFEWPTDEVIRHLKGLTMGDMGALARLDKSDPSRVERVAPVIFYCSEAPGRIKGYLFTLKTNGDARLTCSIYKEVESEPLFTRHIRRQRGGRPFTVRWESSGRPAGFYKLVVKGYFLDTNDRIDQIVSFYHQPLVK